MRRHWTRRERRAGWLVSMALGVGLALAVITLINGAISPTLLALARVQVTNRVTAAVTGEVDRALTDLALSYGDMVSVQTDGQGRIAALTANTAAMNRLRSRVVEGVAAQLAPMSEESVGVPVGNLTGVDLLSGRGPKVRVGLLAPGTGQAEFLDTFAQAGVNQTRHSIDLEVTVKVRLLLPSGAVEEPVTVRVPVAETIIVGTVPQQYVSIGTGDP